MRLGGVFSPDNRVRAYGTTEGSIRLVTPETDEEFEQAKSWVVEAICGGLETEPAKGLSAVSG